MKLSFKNFFVGVSILALTFAAINVTPVFAADLDVIYEKEISESIIAGDGSAENPYILNEETSPMFTQYLEEKGKEAIVSLQVPTVSTFGLFDGILSGTSHGTAPNGAYWKYTSGAPNVNSNGNVWMKSVEYMTYNEVKNMVAGFNSSSYVSVFKGSITEIAGWSLTKAVNHLINKAIQKSIATAFATWLGCGTTFIGAYLILEEYSTFTKQRPYIRAHEAGVGLIHAAYNTSYQGKWYGHSASDLWPTYPIAKDPGIMYGKGTYVKK